MLNHFLDDDARHLFRNREYRRLFAGHLATTAGDRLYWIAAMWLVYSLTGSTVYTGLAGFLARAPGAFQFLIGPAVDRLPFRYTLAVPQVAQGVLILIVPLVALLGHLSVWIVLTLVPVLAIIGQLDNPAQNAMIPQIVDSDRLVRANSLFSVGRQAMSAAATALSGIFVGITGAVAAYVFDSATFLVTGLLFWLVARSVATDNEAADSDEVDEQNADMDDTDDNNADAAEPTSYRDELREGLNFVVGSTVFPMLIAATLGNFLVSAAYAVFPAYADAVGGAATYGLFLAAVSTGMLVGSLGATLVEDRAFGRVTVTAFVVAGMLWAGAVLAPTPLFSIFLFGAAGVPVDAYNVIAISLIQTGVPNGTLGRVMAVVGSAGGVAVPLGSFLGGIAAARLPIAVVLLAPAIGYLGVAAYWVLDPSLRSFGPATGVEPGAFDVRPASASSE